MIAYHESGNDCHGNLRGIAKCWRGECDACVFDRTASLHTLLKVPVIMWNSLWEVFSKRGPSASKNLLIVLHRDVSPTHSTRLATGSHKQASAGRYVTVSGGVARTVSVASLLTLALLHIKVDDTAIRIARAMRIVIHCQKQSNHVRLACQCALLHRSDRHHTCAWLGSRRGRHGVGSHMKRLEGGLQTVVLVMQSSPVHGLPCGVPCSMQSLLHCCSLR